MKVKRIRRRKFNFKKFFKFLLFLIVTISLYVVLSRIPIKNILIKGNNMVTDEEIINVANIENYPSFIKTLKFNIEKKVKSLDLIKEVKVEKKWGFILEINVVEYKILFKIKSTGEYILDTKERKEELNTNNNVPVLINYVPDEILDKMIKKFSDLDDTVIEKISEIEYSPTTYDTGRFLLYMNDGNEVYITLTKIKELNNYTKIKKQLGNKKGILYLDSGNYFEVKE